MFGFRFAIEFIKSNQTEMFTDEGLVEKTDGLNMGQWLSIPLVLFGIFLVLRKVKYLKKGREAYTGDEKKDFTEDTQ